MGTYYDRERGDWICDQCRNCTDHCTCDGPIRCHDCDKTVANVDMAIQADWSPSYDDEDGNQEICAPFCPDCYRKRDEAKRLDRECRACVVLIYQDTPHAHPQTKQLGDLPAGEWFDRKGSLEKWVVTKLKDGAGEKTLCVRPSTGDAEYLCTSERVFPIQRPY